MSIRQSWNARDSSRSKSLKFALGMADTILTRLLEAVGDSLETLDVSQNYDLTDASLSGIRQYNFRLRSLSLNGVKELTAAGLEALFTHPHCH